MVYDQAGAAKLLYKSILRLHRALPPAMQELGTKYVRDEFRRHKNCAPEQALVFMNEWTDYAVTLAKQLGVPGIKSQSHVGKSLTNKELDHFRPEQVQQLYELMVSATQKDEKVKEDKVSDN